MLRSSGVLDAVQQQQPGDLNQPHIARVREEVGGASAEGQDRAAGRCSQVVVCLAAAAAAADGSLKRSGGSSPVAVGQVQERRGELRAERWVRLRRRQARHSFCYSRGRARHRR